MHTLTYDFDKDCALLDSLSDRHLVIGENHDDGYSLQLAEHMVKNHNIEYLLCEHIGWRVVHFSEVDEYIKMCNRFEALMNKYTKSYLGFAVENEITLVGCDYVPNNGTLKEFEQVVYDTDLKQSFKLRESAMANAIQTYSTLPALTLLGDTHLRTKANVTLGKPNLMRSLSDVTVLRLPMKMQECP